MSIPPGLARAWGPELVEDYEERAAIIEFDGNCPRPKAEGMALELLGRVHNARVEARNAAMRNRTPEQAAAEDQARRSEVERTNAEHAARAPEIWPDGKGKRRWK